MISDAIVPMAGEMSASQPAPHSNAMPFAVFFAANAAATHLLEIIQIQLKPENLKTHKDGQGNMKIGYELSVPSLSKERDSKKTWRMGSSLPRKELDHVEPDIILCPPGTSPSTQIARQYFKALHAVLHLHPQSHVLMLTATSSRHPIIYVGGDEDGNDLELIQGRSRTSGLKQSETCVLRRSRNTFRIGEYAFALDFIAQVQKKSKNKVQLTGYPGLRTSPVVNLFPMTDSKTCGKIWQHGMIPGTSIKSGVNIYTGDPMAVKQLHGGTALLLYTSNRLQVACQYDKKRDQCVLGIIDVWCEHNISHPCKLDDDIYYYSMPLAENNFGNIRWTKIEFKKRLALLYQTLLGLADLHQKNITHGDIRPESLLILTESEARRAFVSLSMREPKKKPHPSVCVAPEVWERNDDQEKDETKLDIWALAASWLFAFTVPPKDIKIKEKTYGSIRTTLDDQCKKGFISEPLTKLLRQMLAWKPQDRPSAAGALADQVWEPIKARKQEEEENRKRKRAEMMKSDEKDKRVRVLSPDGDE